MSVTALTYERVNSILDQILAEFGEDYVYVKPNALDGCRYVHGVYPLEQPGCIIGQLLHQLGVPLDALTRHEGKAADVVVKKLFPETDWLVARYLSIIQEEQDSHETWGRAVEYGRMRIACGTFPTRS